VAVSGIKFALNLEKLVHALAFFSRSGVRDLHKAKGGQAPVFRRQRTSFLRYGKPILGDVYYCLPYGPVPSVALNEMNHAIASPEVESEEALADRAWFSEILKVHKPLFDHRARARWSCDWSVERQCLAVAFPSGPLFAICLRAGPFS